MRRTDQAGSGQGLPVAGQADAFAGAFLGGAHIDRGRLDSQFDEQQFAPGQAIGTVGTNRSYPLRTQVGRFLQTQAFAPQQGVEAACAGLGQDVVQGVFAGVRWLHGGAIGRRRRAPRQQAVNARNDTAQGRPHALPNRDSRIFW